MEVYNLFLGAVYLLFGLCIGSFLNVCVWRLPREISLADGRSHCPRCGHVLKPADLVPVLSWLFLGGKCRYCRRPIARRYPFTEALTGIIFLLCFHVFGAGFQSILACLFSSALITAAWIDVDFTYIPDGIPLLVLLIGLAALIPVPVDGIPALFSWRSFGDRTAATVIIGSALLIISVISGGGVGGGDIKLMAAAGFYLGPGKGILAVFAGYVLAAFWAAPALLRGRLHRGTPIPMAPFFAASLILALLWGNRLIHWYMDLVFR